MGFNDIFSWLLLVVIVSEAVATIRRHVTGRATKGLRREALSLLGLVATALFFSFVIRWNTLVPVPLWWLACALVAVAAAVTVSRAVPSPPATRATAEARR